MVVASCRKNKIDIILLLIYLFLSFAFVNFRDLCNEADTF